MNQMNKSVSGNGNDRPLSILTEDDPQVEKSTSAFYDSSNPVFAPPKQFDTEKKKGKKRKLVASFLILLLILGGIGTLYLLLRVSRVNVKVQADARRDRQGSTKPKADSQNSENGLTAEAINITRQELGTDAASHFAPSSVPGPSPSVSPPPSAGVAWRPNYSATEKSPAYGEIGDTGSKGDTDGSSQSQNALTSQVSKLNAANDTDSNHVTQSRANTIQTIFVDDSPSSQITAMTAASKAPPLLRDEKNPAATEKPKTPAAVLPPFGTMLPVRTQGLIFTLRSNSYARLELTRDSTGEGWSLPQGTVFIGRTRGGEYDRAFVNVIGYIDPRDNKLVKMTGEVLGSDGAAGIPGKRIGVDRNRLKHALRKVASSGVQVAGMMAGALGRGTVVVDGAGYRVFNPISDEARRIAGGDDKNTFVKVEAGRPAYVMVVDLPKSLQAVDAPGEDELARAAVSLTDREVMELILFGTPEEIRTAASLMTDEQKQLTLKTLAPENQKP